MDGFGWLLLFFGLLVIAGVYFYSRRENLKPDEQQVPPPRVEPRLEGSESSDTSERDEAVDTPSAADEESSADSDETDAPQKIVTLRIVAHEQKFFPGDDLILNLRGIGLRHGKFGIFHRYDGNDESRTVFSAASLVEPGSFDLENIKDQEIPGISLFLVIPGPIDGIEGFDQMMTAARTLAQSLNGELLDESGSTLSIQRERYMREEVIQFQHTSMMA
jgi:cell division protein ZipA